MSGKHAISGSAAQNSITCLATRVCACAGAGVGAGTGAGAGAGGSTTDTGWASGSGSGSGPALGGTPSSAVGTTMPPSPALLAPTFGTTGVKLVKAGEGERGVSPPPPLSNEDATAVIFSAKTPTEPFTVTRTSA